MKSFLSFVGGLILIALVVLLFISGTVGLSWLGTENQYRLNQHYQPRNRQVEYDTFKQSQPYRDGQVQELYRMQDEYIRSTSDQQDALRPLILHRVEAFPPDALPSDLAAFISDLRKHPRTQYHYGTNP
jgi:hypothetical protein